MSNLGSKEMFIVSIAELEGKISFKIFQEIDVQGKKAIIIFVPVPQLRNYQKIQTRLVRELEKKFSGKHVVFIAQVCRLTIFSGIAFKEGRKIFTLYI